MKRCFVSLLALALAAPAARAHFIWVVPDKDGASFQVVFSDNLQSDDPKLLEKIKGAESFVRTKDGKTVALKWTEGKNAYVLTPPNKPDWDAVGLVCPYGVVQRGKGEPFLLNYYAMYGKRPGGGKYVAEGAWDKMPLQFNYGDKGLQVLWQGKPLADAEVSVLVPAEEKAQESKTDKDGKVTVALTKAGLYAIRVRHVEDKAGKHDGKDYKEVRHYSTRVVWLDPDALDRKAAAEPNPAATKLLAEARASRAVWKDFPGFTADVEVNFDGKTAKGKVTVSAGGKDVSLEGIDKPFDQWTRRLLESIVNHRLPGSGERETPCAFTDDVTDHPLGREIRVLNDELHSSYRVRGKEIVVVNRTMKDRKFTITVLESMTNKEGKYLTTSYVVDYWNLKAGDLVRGEGTSQTWTRVGAFDLPGTTRVVTARGKSFDGEAAEDAFTARSVTLSNHKLLQAAEK